MGYHRVYLVTGQARPAIRQRMGAQLTSLGPVQVCTPEQARRKAFQKDDLVVVDVRFTSHQQLSYITSGPARYVEVRAGTGGILQQTKQRLGIL